MSAPGLPCSGGCSRVQCPRCQGCAPPPCRLPGAWAQGNSQAGTWTDFVAHSQGASCARSPGPRSCRVGELGSPPHSTQTRRQSLGQPQEEVGRLHLGPHAPPRWREAMEAAGCRVPPSRPLGVMSVPVPPGIPEPRTPGIAARCLPQHWACCYFTVINALRFSQY